jgi:hypothetical protein
MKSYSITVTAMAYARADLVVDAQSLDHAIILARMDAVSGAVEWKLDGVDNSVIGAEGAEVLPITVRRRA